MFGGSGGGGKWDNGFNYSIKLCFSAKNAPTPPNSLCCRSTGGGCLTAPESVKESPNYKDKKPSCRCSRGRERILPELRQRRLFRAVASRQRSRNSGGRRRLAAEIPDIFIPLTRNDVRNDDGGGACSGAMRRGLMRFLVLWGALLPFVLMVVAGACLGRWTGQPRMPPRERQHEGVGFLRRREGAGNPGMMAVWGDFFTCSLLRSASGEALLRIFALPRNARLRGGGRN